MSSIGARPLAGALIAATVVGVVRRLPEPAVTRWRRRNFRDRDVSLSTGLGAAVGLASGVLVAGDYAGPALFSVTAAALAGAYDDLQTVEQRGDKGLAGHLAAARAGRLSGGAVKVLTIGASALVAAVWLDPQPRVARVLLRAGLIAGSANLVNLVDLRPGRAGKLAVLAALAGLRGPAAALSAVALGAAAASLPDDLAERGMLGDLGANALGATLGLRLAAASPVRGVVAAAVIAALTLASERVSFSQVIDSAAPLRFLDQVGRRP